ncbi:MAG: hypothetical protein EOO39_05760 [Cytophagaceae bacterium]|nr:MAG: hypothetical protein EOO39_05760 [Cytophagaceae bacterium]
MFTNPQGVWYISVRDAIPVTQGGDLDSWYMNITYTVPTGNAVTWSPSASLYTDPGATVAYTGQQLTTVYAKPSATTTYMASNGPAGCSSSKAVTVTVSPIPMVSIAADYCAVTNGVRLTASSVPAGASFLWSTGATTATVDVTAAQRYEVSATFGGCTGTNSIDFARNLIVNGDFGDDNNINFQSSYTRNQGEDQLRFGGNFALGSEALYHSSWDATYPYFYGRDRTFGYGYNSPYRANYMIVNGSNLPFVWQQTINVQPNTTYYFSAYGRSMNANGTPFAKLRFAINDVQTGTTANLVPGVNDNVNNPWPASGRFGGSWTSGPTTTTAKITVLDLETSTIQTANDFGLDDISFGTLSSFVALESVFGTDAQSKCINTPIDNIVYNVGNGSTTAPVITGLPAGVTAVQTGDKVTISGTPTVAGTFNYSITTQGSCNSTVTTGSITVTSQTIAVTAGVVSPTVCINTPLNIGYTIGGTATGIGTITGLPAGLTVSAITNKSFTITGSPTAAGVYAYTIPTTDITGCAAATISGTITVQAQSISLTSANASQVVCINTQIANVQYTVSGTATGATVSGLPTGLNVTYNSGLLFIAGTPTQAGSFNFTVTTSGGCTPVTATGNITVTPQAVLALASGSNTQTVCANTAIANIVYNVSAATGATVTGLPAGLTGSYNSGMFTISGNTSAQGTFNYTVTTSGGCGAGSATGAISIQSQTLQLSSGIASPSICANTSIQNIVYSFGGSATGATVSGLPAGINGILSGNTVTISGATAAQGSYPYQVTSSGSCSNVIANGVITIQPSAAGGALTSLAVCNGGSGTLTVADQVGAIIRWEYSINGGSSWITIANTNITQSFTNITSPRLYRVVVGNNCGQAISSVAAVSLNNYWTGAADGNWNNPANWSSNQLPSAAGACPATYIMAGMPNQPVLNSGTASIRDLVIANGANLTVNGTGTLQLSGTITNNGIFDIASGRLELNGTTAQQVSGNMFAGKMVGSLVNSNPAGISAAAAPADTLKIRISLGFGSVSNSVTQTNNNITLISTAALTAGVGKVLNGNSISGNVNAERFINSGRKWRLMAVPVNTGQSFKSSWMENAAAAQNPVPGYGMQVTDFRSSWAANGFDNLSAGGPSVKSYNPLTGLYEGITNTANAIDTRSGYMSFIRGDRSAGVSGSNSASTVLRLKGLVRQGTQPAVIIPSTRFAVVGNPYPSAIDLRQVNRTNTTLDLYVWDPSLGGSFGLGAFRTLALNDFTNNYETVPGGEVYNFIESGQAFFVRARNGDGFVTFDEQDKTDTIDNNIAFFTSGNASRLRVDLSIANAGNSVLADGVMASFSAGAAPAVDFDDAVKITNTGENVSLKRDGNLLAIERRPTIQANDTLFLELTGVRYQTYKWNISGENMDAPGLQGWLIDAFTSVSTPLNLAAGNWNWTLDTRSSLIVDFVFGHWPSCAMRC